MAFSPLQKQEYKNHEWRVETKDEKTSAYIILYLLKQGKYDDKKIPMYYMARLKHVFVVDFEVVDHLVTNRHTLSYQFTAYHRRKNDSPWQMSKEGMPKVSRENPYNRMPAEKKLVKEQVK